MADKRVSGGGGPGRRSGGGQGRGRGAQGGGGRAGGGRFSSGGRSSEGRSSAGPRQPRAMKSGGYSPAPESGRKREAPRWSDFPEHKSKSRGPERGFDKRPARGTEQRFEKGAAGPQRRFEKGPEGAFEKRPSRGPERKFEKGRGKSDRFSRGGETGARRREDFSRSDRAERPAFRKEERPAREPSGRFKPAPAFEKPARKATQYEEFAPLPPEKLSTGAFVSPQLEEGIVAGLNPVIELLRSGDRPIDILFIDKDKGGSQFEQMLALARQKGVQVRVVPRAALDKMAFGVRHQGAVATVPPKEYADAYKLAEDALAKGKPPLLVILDGVEDPHNLGAIIRTAEGAGADGVIIPEHRAAHLTSTVSKASAGALEHLPVAKVSNLANYLNFLKEKGFWTVGLTGDAKEPYNKPDMTVPIALVLGGEGAGIRPVVKNSCDMLVSLPMLGKVSSLNVSVAAGIMLYEVLRQRAR